MAVKSDGVELLSQVGGESLDNGGLVITLTEVYRAITDDGSDGPLTVLDSNQLPQTGAQAVSPSGTIVYVTDRDAKREHGNTKPTHWLVTVNYTSMTGTQEGRFPTNESGQQVSDPTQSAQEVEMVYTTEYEPVAEGKFVKARRVIAATGISVDVATPPGFANYVGPIASSSYEHKSTAKRRKSILTLRVTRVVDTWPASWDAVIDKKNNAAVTITESDADGVAFTRTYQAGELLCLTIQKRPMRVAGKLYYRATFVLLVDKENKHVISHPDTGTYRRLFADQYKNNVGETNEQWTPAQILGLRSRWQRIESDDGESYVVQDVPLNGWGQEIPKARDTDYAEDDRFFLDYDVVDDTDYAVLGMT